MQAPDPLANPSIIRRDIRYPMTLSCQKIVPPFPCRCCTITPAPKPATIPSNIALQLTVPEPGRTDVDLKMVYPSDFELGCSAVGGEKKK